MRQYVGRLERWISYCLYAGLYVSGVLIVTGFLLAAFQNAPDLYTVEPESIREELSLLAKYSLPLILHHPRSLVLAGILVLMVTPIARVAFLVFFFLFQREWRFVFLSILVLAFIGLSIGIAVLG